MTGGNQGFVVSNDRVQKNRRSDEISKNLSEEFSSISPKF